MAEPSPSFNPNSRTPRLELPRGACDTHFHVFGPQRRFAFAPERSYTPTCDAPKETLFALHAKLGIERGVVVQSAAHGFDNSAAADLLASNRNYRGIALLPASTNTKELNRLHAQGFRGVRFHYMEHMGKGDPIDHVLAMAKRLADIGWHLQIHMDGPRIIELAPELARSPVPVVIDHMGRVDASQGARKLVAEFGERVLWGSDWPHPNLAVVPDDGDLVDFIGDLTSEKERQALFVDNPARLYGF
jgi:2-pyrone-4,6-dicarboxylate lactonase